MLRRFPLYLLGHNKKTYSRHERSRVDFFVQKRTPSVTKTIHLLIMTKSQLLDNQRPIKYTLSGRVVAPTGVQIDPRSTAVNEDLYA